MCVYMCVCVCICVYVSVCVRMCVCVYWIRSRPISIHILSSPRSLFNLRQYEIPERTEAMKGKVRENWEAALTVNMQYFML